MTATATPPVVAGHPAGPPVARPVTQRRVIASEWIKLRTLRSTVITLAVSIVAVVGLSLLISYFTNQHWSSMAPDERARFNPVDRSLAGYNIGQLAFAVLGVLLITGEYSTGMIRATFSAVPKRLPVLWAKLAVFGAVALVVSMVSSFAAFLGGQALLGSHGVSLSSPGALRAVVGVGLYLTVVGLFSMAIGFLLRNTAGGIAAVFAILLVIPGLANVLPSNWQPKVIPYLPSNAGQALLTLRREGNMMHPWPGFLVFCLYAAVLIAAAAVTLRRRDA
jgi:ABC-2 type transport system permease protein